jgi:hypothetical protein
MNVVKQNRHKIAFLAFVALFQYPAALFKTGDLGDMRIFLFSVAGAAGLAATAWKGRPSRAMLVVLALLAMAFLVTPWVQDYTVYAAVYMAAGLGLALAVSRVDAKWGLAAVIIMWAAQVILCSQGFQPWAHSYSNLFYGTVRNAIRYQTILMAATVAACGLACHYLSKKNKMYVPVVLLACAFYPFWRASTGEYLSHSVFASWVAAVSVLTFAYMGWKAGLVAVAVLALGFSAIIYFGYQPAEKFGIDQTRGEIYKKFWPHVVENWKLGKGLGAYRLNEAAILGKLSGHPHCEALHLIYNFGLPWFLALLAVTCFVMRRAEAWTIVLFGALSLSFMTNSGRYPDMALLWATSAGMAAKGELWLEE